MGSSGIEQRRAARRRKLYEESRTVKHLMLHSPTNPYCKACMYGKAWRMQHRKGAMNRKGERPTEEGELLTMDWMILRNRSGGVMGEQAHLLLLDVFS